LTDEVGGNSRKETGARCGGQRAHTMRNPAAVHGRMRGGKNDEEGRRAVRASSLRQTKTKNLVPKKTKKISGAGSGRSLPSESSGAYRDSNRSLSLSELGTVRKRTAARRSSDRARGEGGRRRRKKKGGGRRKGKEESRGSIMPCHTQHNRVLCSVLSPPCCTIRSCIPKCTKMRGGR